MADRTFHLIRRKSQIKVKLDLRWNHENKWSISFSCTCQMAPTSTVQEAGVWGRKVGTGVESCKIVFLGPLPIHLFRHFYCRTNTIHSISHIQTDDSNMSRNTSDCVYSSVLTRILVDSSKAAPLFLSLHIVSQLATIPCEMSPICHHKYQQWCIVSEGRV